MQLFVLAVLYLQCELGLTQDIISNNNTSDAFKRTDHMYNGKKLNKNLWFFQNGSVYPEEQKLITNLFPLTVDDDRIIDQLLYVPKGYNPTLSKMIVLHLGFVREGHLKGNIEFKRCPVNRCRLTEKGEDWHNAHAVIFDRNSPYFDQRIKIDPNQVWIYYTRESPYKNYRLKFTTPFNWTMDYTPNSDVPIPYNRWVYYDPDVSFVCVFSKFLFKNINNC